MTTEHNVKRQFNLLDLIAYAMGHRQAALNAMIAAKWRVRAKHNQQ